MSLPNREAKVRALRAFKRDGRSSVGVGQVLWMSAPEAEARVRCGQVEVLERTPYVNRAAPPGHIRRRRRRP